MTVQEAVARRRATTGFDPSFVVDHTELLRLMDLACQAPSAMNLQPWRFLLCESEDEKARLHSVSYMQDPVAEASVVVVVLGDLCHHHSAPRVAADQLARGAYDPERARRYLAECSLFYEDELERRRDEMFRGCSLWAMAFMLLATEQGWDTTPMAGFEPDKLLAEFGLPDHLLPTMMVCVGRRRADGPVLRRGVRFSVDELIYHAH